MEVFGEISRILGAAMFSGFLTSLLFLTVAYQYSLTAKRRLDDLEKIIVYPMTAAVGAISGMIAGLIISAFKMTILPSALIGGAAFGVFAFLTVLDSLEEVGYSIPLKHLLALIIPLVLSAIFGVSTAAIFNKTAV